MNSNLHLPHFRQIMLDRLFDFEVCDVWFHGKLCEYHFCMLGRLQQYVVCLLLFVPRSGLPTFATNSSHQRKSLTTIKSILNSTHVIWIKNLRNELEAIKLITVENSDFNLVLQTTTPDWLVPYAISCFPDWQRFSQLIVLSKSN